MKLTIHYESVDCQPAMTRAISQWAQQHLEPLLAGIGMPVARLVVTLASSAKGDRTRRVKLRVHLPKRHIIIASADHADVRTAMRTAQARLLRQLERHFDRLRHQAAYRRKTRRERLRALKARMASQPAASMRQADAHIEPLLQRLERIIRRELAYLRHCGELPGDYPGVQDVLDEAIIAVKADWQQQDCADASLQRLLREAYRVIDAELEASRRKGTWISLDASPAPDAEDEAEAMVEEEMFEFYQPDDTLKLSDVLVDDTVPTPDLELEEEQQAFALETISGLPLSWRRVLLLADFEQLSTTEIAAILALESKQIDTWLQQSRDYLREHLRWQPACNMRA